MNNCPICGQNNTDIIFKKGNLDKDLINVICKNCGLAYINPCPSKEDYDNFHKEEFLSEKNVVDLAQVEIKLKENDLIIKRDIFDFIKEYLKEGQNVLDIGCGFGTLLYIIRKEKKADIFGIELGDLDIRAAKEFYGLDLFHGSLEAFSQIQENNGKFDVIILHHTFEHFPEPMESLGQIKKFLKPTGVLYVGVPNIMNIKKRPEIFFQRAHPFSYSPHSLKLLLEKAGFGIVKFNRNAGYPGGMELVAAIGAKNIDSDILQEGDCYREIINYIKICARRFDRMRGMRDCLLFFLPADIRIKLGRGIYKFLKYRK